MSPLAPYQDPALPTNEDVVNFTDAVPEMMSEPPPLPPRQPKGLSFDFDGLIGKLQADGFDSLTPAQQELLWTMKEGVQYSPEEMASFVQNFNTQLAEKSSPKAQAELSIAQDTLAKNEAERAKLEREKQESVTRATNEYKRMTGLIDKLKSHPGRLWSTGGSSMMPAAKGTDAYDFQVLLEQLRGKQFLAGFQSLKGGGQITELEGTKAQAAVARTDPGQSETSFVAGLDDFKSFLTEEYNSTLTKYGAAQQTQAAPADPFTLGKRYRDAAGNVRTYKGNGAWE